MSVITCYIEDNVAIILADNPPVNAFSSAVRESLLQCLQDLADRTAEYEAIVIGCRGRTFFAGADIREFDQVRRPPLLNEIVPCLEAFPCPIVAAIHGTALGGGLELALGCHARIATASARMGLPEVNIGIVPGAGGTQRLPRLIGARRSLDVIVLGEFLDADEALRLGLIDRIAGEALISDAKEMALSLAREEMGLRKVRDLVTQPLDASEYEEFRRTNARRLRNLEAPQAAIACIKAATELPFEEGIRFEHQCVQRLLTGPQAPALRYAFFAERSAGRLPLIEGSSIDEPSIRRLAIIGAGTMGRGISAHMLKAGLEVTLIDVNEAALESASEEIKGILTRRSHNQEMSPEVADEMYKGLRTSTKLDNVSDADLVIEATSEQMEVKKAVFRSLDEIAGPDAILATNTSYLDVNEIALATSRPHAVLGLHFFSPANVMRLLEVVRGEQAAPAVVARALRFARSVGKLPVISGVCHGFIGNRMQARRRVEFDEMVLEGVAPARIDSLLENFGMAMGPFRTLDLAGLDVRWSAQTSLHETPRDLMNEMGRHGQKVGRGFYDYVGRKAVRSLEVENALLGFAREKGVPSRDISDEEILERAVLSLINEGAGILEESIAQRASDIDVVWVHGYGWPRWRGGPMYHADMLGLPDVVGRLRHYQQLDYHRFAPAPLLIGLAERGQSLTGAASPMRASET